MKISITRAKKTLPNLIRAVESGERAIIVRRGKPVAELLPVTKPSQKRPRFGTPRGKVIIHDPNWWKPMTDEEADAFLAGRYGI